MLVVVEGPTAAGKTTWCRRHHPDHVVDEYQPDGREPTDDDPAVRAAYWIDVGCARWRAALAREAATGRAVCDGDPLKLHYTWGLASIGEIGPQWWRHEVAAARRAIAAGRLGFADLVLVSIPDPAELRRRRDGDPTRRRRGFALHARLAEPLRLWYEAVDRLEPGRVRWELPAAGLPAELPAPRADRSPVALLDALLTTLPALPGPA